MNFNKGEKEDIKIIHKLEQREIDQVTSKLRTALGVVVVIMVIIFWGLLIFFAITGTRVEFIAIFQFVLFASYYILCRFQRKGSTKHEEEHKKEGERYGIQGEFKKFKMTGFYLCNNDQYSLVPNFMRMLLAPFKKLCIIDCICVFALSLLTCGFSEKIGIELSAQVIGFIMTLCMFMYVILIEGYIPDISATIKLKKYRGYLVYMERQENFDLSSTEKLSDTDGMIWYVIFEKNLEKEAV